MFSLYKIVVREIATGRVLQIHEVYRPDVARYVLAAVAEDGISATVTKL